MKDFSFIGFRATNEERSRLESLSEASGLGLSEVLRSLIKTATVEGRPEFTASIKATKNGDSAKSRQGLHTVTVR